LQLQFFSSARICCNLTQARKGNQFDLCPSMPYNKAMERNLPIGMQDFASIRKEGFCYVDKTALVHRLATGSGRAFFMSRPRRFGKSLLCSTMEAFFEGHRELFGEIAGFPELAINTLEWEWERHPVIRLDLNVGDYNDGTDFLDSTLSNALGNVASRHGLELRGQYTSQKFTNLVMDMYERFNKQVAVIIDEYDKPLLDTMMDVPLHTTIRNKLKGFYGILKPSDRYLRFVFLTGVTKFSHVSIFSDLNHLVDLTLDHRYADICGITQEELEANFEPEIESISKETGRNRKEYLEKLRRFYNGYRFSKKPIKVYNPFGLLSHFESGEFSSYWYETGTPTFLVKLIANQKINIIDLNNMYVGDRDFRKYDIENMRAEPLLYQSGYLTIKDHDGESKLYTLDFPNVEVRSCFASSLVDQYLQSSNSNETAGGLNTRLLQALLKGDVEGAINALRGFFAAIPYDIIRESENYYETAVHLIFTMLGFNCRSEVRIAAGRIDTLVETKNFVYCFEFKLNKTAEEALAQIDTKEYLLPWEGCGKKLFKVGVGFDHGKRNIGSWETRQTLELTSTPG